MFDLFVSEHEAHKDLGGYDENCKIQYGWHKVIYIDLDSPYLYNHLLANSQKIKSAKPTTLGLQLRNCGSSVPVSFSE